MKTLRQIVDRVSQHNGDIGIGRMTHELNQLAPDEIQQVRTGLKHMEFVEQIGRHGNKTDALDYMGVDRSDHSAATRIFEAVQADDIATTLIERRGGADIDQPLPALTSRDFVEAAFQAHNGD